MLHSEMGPHTQAFLELSSLHNACEISAIFGVNFPSWFVIPMNLRSSVRVVGLSIATIAEVFWGSGVTPSLLITCPKNVRLSLLNSHFSLLSVTPALLNLLQGCMETSIMLLLSMAKNQYIVYVAQDSLLTGKDSFHLPLKMLRGTRDPKW